MDGMELVDRKGREIKVGSRVKYDDEINGAEPGEIVRIREPINQDEEDKEVGIDIHYSDGSHILQSFLTFMWHPDKPSRRIIDQLLVVE